LRIQCVVFLALLFPCATVFAQSQPSPPILIYGEYSRLSNSFNGVPGSHQALNGGNAGIAFQSWHHLRFRFDYSMYRGMNLGDPQHAFFILGGGQYEAMFHRERFYAVALAGEGGLNGTWFKANSAGYKNGNTGMIASFAEFLGGGADTPIGSHAAFRIEGGVQHSGFEPIEPDARGSQPYHLNGIPNYFGRVSAGVVWIPRTEPAAESSSARRPVESEIVFEGLNSVGHIHIFANSWWSYLTTAGVEYDRHSWGNFLGARVDYSGEILPVLVLRQPSKTDIWGNRRSRTLETVPGVGVYPIGMRLMWNDGGRLKPYYEIKGGMTGYTKKTFSQFASYENFSLDQSVGMQIGVTSRTDFRTGFGILHQSNGFVVPSNPGLDAMNWNVGIAYHLGRQVRPQ
jgi:hypothetical protein